MLLKYNVTAVNVGRIQVEWMLDSLAMEVGDAFMAWNHNIGLPFWPGQPDSTLGRMC